MVGVRFCFFAFSSRCLNVCAERAKEIYEDIICLELGRKAPGPCRSGRDGKDLYLPVCPCLVLELKDPLLLIAGIVKPPNVPL